MESDDQSKLIDFIDSYSTSDPIQYFQHSPTKNHTLARSQNHALFCILDQMKIPISLESENVSKWLIYKQSAVHRHQKFFGMFRFLAKLVKKYNDTTILKKWNGIYKRSSNSGDDMYLFENDALRFIGCAYLRRIFLLDKIRETCCKCAENALGMLEIDHWTNLMLVIVAICGEVLSDSVEQMKSILKAWKFVGNVVKKVDSRFPETLDNFEVVQRILSCGISLSTESVESSSDYQSIIKLLKFSKEKMEDAQTENQIIEIRNKVLDDLKMEEVKKLTGSSKNDLGVSISRDEFLGLSNDSESPSTSHCSNDTLLSPTLFTSKSTKKQKAKKRKNPSSSSFDNSFLQSTLGLLTNNKKSK
ncbi:unnamed protein product [Caenorhabditis angaria]|uniref:Nucleolus and neural progenitor protein-like N-terminal domain-containing protein n=1 Tax=Caenorhabditis angaria TaxID=860376 RepID=A0A9P1I8J7_9PELO|nr:unnamed protein product [Caenorhabditis angaria]